MQRELTDAWLRTLAPPAVGRLEVWDKRVRGLVLRITPNGTFTWSARARTADRKAHPAEAGHVAGSRNFRGPQARSGDCGGHSEGRRSGRRSPHLAGHPVGAGRPAHRRRPTDRLAGREGVGLVRPLSARGGARLQPRDRPDSRQRAHWLKPRAPTGPT